MIYIANPYIKVLTKKNNLYNQKPLNGVKGRIQTSSYESNGEKKYSMDIIAEKVSFLSSKSKEAA